MRFVICRMVCGRFNIHRAVEVRKGNKSWRLLPGAGIGLTMADVMEFIGLN
jgi:hypothetical protein